MFSFCWKEDLSWEIHTRILMHLSIDALDLGYWGMVRTCTFIRYIFEMINPQTSRGLVSGAIFVCQTPSKSRPPLAGNHEHQTPAKSKLPLARQRASKTGSSLKSLVIWKEAYGNTMRVTQQPEHNKCLKSYLCVWCEMWGAPGPRSSLDHSPKHYCYALTLPE